MLIWLSIAHRLAPETGRIVISGSAQELAGDYRVRSAYLDVNYQVYRERSFVEKIINNPNDVVSECCRALKRPILQWYMEGQALKDSSKGEKAK